MALIDADARSAEMAPAIATGVATSPKPHSPPEGVPVNKLWRRFQLEGAAETRSLCEPGARVAIGAQNEAERTRRKVP